MTTPMPDHPVFPIDLDLTEATAFADKMAALCVTHPELTQAQQTRDLMRSLIAEIQSTRRDRDSARHTILTVSSLVPRWRKAVDRYNTHVMPSEFERGLIAAADTLADILARQMLRD